MVTIVAIRRDTWEPYNHLASLGVDCLQPNSGRVEGFALQDLRSSLLAGIWRKWSREHQGFHRIVCERVGLMLDLEGSGTIGIGCVLNRDGHLEVARDGNEVPAGEQADLDLNEKRDPV